MGPALVATMVQAEASRPQPQKLHPFFTKAPDGVDELSLPQAPTAAIQDLEDATSIPESDEGSGRKKRPTGEVTTAENTPAPKKQRRKRTSARESLNGSITDHLTRPEKAPAHAEVEETPPDHIPTPPQSDISTKASELPKEDAQDANWKPLAVPTSAADSTQPPPASKKVLKLNPRTGTLGSPPKPKRAKATSLKVTIKYGHDEEHRKTLGGKISQILEGTYERPKTPTKKRPQKKDKASKKVNSKDGIASKDTHPFFTGKTNPVHANATPPTDEPKKSPIQRHTISMATPVSPRRQRNPFAVTKPVNLGSLRPAGTKVPGAVHPAWPSLGMAHVRGDDTIGPGISLDLGEVAPLRKFKGQVVDIRSEDSVLGDLMEELSLDSLRDNMPRDENTFEPPPPQLRLPKQRFESGRKLQHRMRPQLRTVKALLASTQEDPDLDELQQEMTLKTHPAVARLFKGLESSLSAYDTSTCESCAWTQKYAPVLATEVLQAGKEALYLKDWLETLKVQAVDTGENTATKSKTKGERAPRKRRKNKLDDFVVDDDDEEFDLDEVSDDESEWHPAGPGLQLKTVIRGGRSKDQGRLPNAVVISGPHGSGKTAAVYAVSKELGFEIFEINSSSRRSGKDLLERVGDMTRNHLVQQHRAEATAAEAESDDEVAKDLKSGKQGMMTSFFKPKPGATVNPTASQKGDKAKTDMKPVTKAQKQSLILLEEVDVLYDEDKQFWATLLSLIAQSKRPFIMTCNNENVVPLQSLNLYGILRLSPPPTELATDVCLLIAANEGHVLQRDAVEALYLSRGNDLRAAITELNYWCQIGVGDRRGGFDWFLRRWPKGCDLDENGDVVRVISDGTYKKGMGWMARDAVVAPGNEQQADEEAMRQCWYSWSLDIEDWARSPNRAASTGGTSRLESKADRADSLGSYQALCQAMSDCDMLSSSTFGTHLQDLIDPTIPDLPAKMKDDFISGWKLLDAEPYTSPTTLECGISTSLSSFAGRNFYNTSGIRNATVISADPGLEVEQKAITVLESSFKKQSNGLTRKDLSLAFDPIAVSESETGTHLTPSVFDRTLKLIVLDVAPWVRSIVEFDHQLMVERKKLSSLLSEGGQKKRMRNTRAAYSAMEGGERKSTRREKYFQGSLNTTTVLMTGSEAWLNAAKESMGDIGDMEQSNASTPGADAMDVDSA